MAFLKDLRGIDAGNYIYKNGVLKIPMAAYDYRPYDWTAPTRIGGSLSNVNRQLIISQNYDAGCTSWISDAFDLTDLTEMKIVVDDVVNLSNFRFLITQELKDLYNYELYQAIPTLTAGTYTKNLSSKTGMWRFAISCNTANYSSNKKVYISEISMT